MKKHLFSILSYFVLPLLAMNSIFAETVGDYDGDGKTDIVVRRFDFQGNSSHIYWFILRSSDSKFSATQWGLDTYELTDQAVMGDFDGDRKADIGVFRKAFSLEPIPNYFFILRSSDNTMLAVQWGYAQDREMAQDYDGDGKTDIAIARSELANGWVWYILGSRVGFMSCSVRGSTPIRGDYDGDGKADIAVWLGKNKSPSGYWYWLRSSDGNWGRVRLGWGFTNGDYAVPGDYDGDGKTNPAIFRTGDESSTQAYFYILGSRSGFYGVPWGVNYLDGAPLFDVQVR